MRYMAMALVLAGFGSVWALEPPASGPALVCEAPVVDFGVTNSDSTVSHTFVLRNGGAAVLAIHRVRPSCGCISAILSTNRIPPGGEARLEVAFNLRGLNGPQRKGVTVESREPHQPPVRLEMAGMVEAELDIRPRALHFGERGAEESAERYCDLIASSNITLNILGLENDSAAFGASLVTNTPGRSYRLVVRALTSDLGRSETVLRLRTDHPRYGVIGIPVSAAVVGDLVATPSQFTVFASETNRFSPRVFTVSSRSGRAFRVLEARLPFPEGRVRIEPPGEGRQRVIVESLPVSAQLNGRDLELVTDRGTNGTIRIPIRIQPGS